MLKAPPGKAKAVQQPTRNQQKRSIANNGGTYQRTDLDIGKMEGVLEEGSQRPDAEPCQKNIKIGDIVVCDRAIRDEGVSHHYLASSKYAQASEEMTSRIKKSLDELDIAYVTGTSWTTDAVYRETIAEVEQYQKGGVATVEMEASALFSVAQYRNVQVGCILTISDSLADLKWQPQFHSDETTIGLELLFKAALNALQDGD